MNLWTREEFAAKRRQVQEDAEEFLLGQVEATLPTWADTLQDRAEELWRAIYRDESGENPDPNDTRMAKLMVQLEESYNKSTDDTLPSVAALMLATAILNNATTAAAQDDPEELALEWVTMHDDAVRADHRETDGQARLIGDKFDVGGVEMTGPGDVTAPIELWINCRCALRPTLASEVIAASFSVSEKSWDGSASRFTPEQWKKSCVVHICQGVEKSCHKLPIREPGGALSRAGVHAAAARINQVDAPSSAVASAKRALRGAYRVLGEDPPDVLQASIEENEMTAEVTEQTQDQEVGLIPWHGILAPEGVFSGDGRQFLPDSLSFRDLPLPLTWQRVSDDGHKGSVTVGSIETIERVDGMMRATGFMLDTPESDEVIGLMAHFGKYGVSVDADDVEFEYDEDSMKMSFSKARIASASIVSIPAFAEAYVALGPWEKTEEVEDLVAAGVRALFGRGPGWLTDPIATKRIHDYWTRPGEEGYAKIGWGKGGDFNRCRLLVGEKIAANSPEDLRFLNQICAQWHHDALGIWPGEHMSGEVESFADGAPDITQALRDNTQAPALALVAAGVTKAPACWFENPNFTKTTHLTVTEEGQVFGHIAEWGVCHIGYDGVCIEPPKSPSGYANYATGTVLLDDGSAARTGVISLGSGHAPQGYRARAAVEHYDSTSAAVADVCVGEDEFGIWCAGWVRPGTSDEQVYALRASDVSGDWRKIGGEYEMVAALAVNVAGFPVKVGIENGEQITLIAAGVVHRESLLEDHYLDPVEVGKAIAAEMRAIDSRREKLKVIADRMKGGDNGV